MPEVLVDCVYQSLHSPTRLFRGWSTRRCRNGKCTQVFWMDEKRRSLRGAERLGAEWIDPINSDASYKFRRAWSSSRALRASSLRALLSRYADDTVVTMYFERLVSRRWREGTTRKTRDYIMHEPIYKREYIAGYWAESSETSETCYNTWTLLVRAVIPELRKIEGNARSFLFP